MIEYALVHDDQTIETGRPTHARVTEPITEMVDVYEERPVFEDQVNPDTGETESVQVGTENVLVGQRPEPTGETHEVITTVSLPTDGEIDYEALGWVPITEVNLDDTRAQVPGEITLVAGVPTREWTSITDIQADPTTIPADGTTVSTVVLRLAGTAADWPERVDVKVNDEPQGDVAVTTAGNAFVDVAASTPGPVDVTIHDQTITLHAEEVTP